MLGIHRLQFLNEVARRPSHSFISYYTASYLLAQGEDVNQFYDGDWFSAQVFKITPTIEEYYVPNPPTTSFILLPLAQHTHLNARILWTIFNLIIVSCAVAWILWIERFSLTWGAIALIVALLYQPMIANFEYGQLYGLLFVAFTIIGYGYKHSATKLTGITWGTIVIMKTAGWLLVLLWLVKRQWNILLWSSLIIGFISLLSLPIVGFQSWLTFSQALSEYSQRPAFTVTAYQNIPSFFKHQFIADPVWNPSPIIHVPMLGTILSLCVIVALLGITFWKGREDKHPMMLYSAMILLSVMVSPASLDYHSAILLLPILLLLADVQSMSRPQKLGLLIAIILLSVDYRYHDDVYSNTFLSLMAYPKLIGSLILWSVTVNRMSAR
jgi:hypothetical protein